MNRVNLLTIMNKVMKKLLTNLMKHKTIRTCKA